MTENNQIPTPNVAYQVTPAYPTGNAPYNPIPYATPSHAQTPKQKNGTAVAGFVLSLICVLLAITFLILIFVVLWRMQTIFGVIFSVSTLLFALISLIISIVGANKSKRRGSGLGLSLTGIIISTIMLVLLTIASLGFISDLLYYSYY